MKDVLQVIGKRCKEYRQSINRYQFDVAQDTGYSVENISSFENGRNDNARILLWYVEHGMTFDCIIEGVTNGEDV